MSPFAAALRGLRFERGLRQADLADLVGCHRTYVSALENDLSVAPPAQFVDRLAVALALSAGSKESVEQARQRSRRAYQVPDDAPQEVYEFLFDLFQKIDRLSAPKVEALGKVLNLPDKAEPLPRHLETRVRRSDRRAADQPDEENAM